MHGPSFAPATTPAAHAPAPRPAPPRPAAPARPAAKPDPESGGSRVLTYLRLHWLTILFCGTLLGGVGSYAAWELLPSKFESYALLQVSSVPTALANPNNPNQARTDFATYMKTTAALIKYEFVLNAALRDIKDLPTIKAQKDPIKFLSEELQVAASDGSEVIKISLQGHNPVDTKKIVDAVQKAFMREVIEKDVREKELFIGKVKKAMEETENVLRGKTPVKPVAKGAPNGGANPAGPGVAGRPPQDAPGAPGAPGVNVMDELVRLNPQFLVGKVVGLHAQFDNLPFQISDAKKRLAIATARLEALQKGPPDPSTVAAVEKDPEVVRQAILVRAAKHKYEFQRNASGNPNAPGVLGYKADWDAQEAQLRKIKHEKTHQLEGARRIEEAKQVAAERDAARRELERYEEQYKSLEAALNRFGRQLAELPTPVEKGGTTVNGLLREGPGYSPQNTDLAMTDAVYANLVRQYHLTRLELDSPERVRVLQPASNPVQRDIRKQVLASVFAGLMGYAVIAIGLVAFETMGRRVSSLADLKAAGSAPVVGVIPGQPSEATGRDPGRRAAANEAIDKLRAYVAQTWLARGATTVAITSPLEDEGKAFTSFGLASSLAQAGYRTLLVDFDLREPALHTYAGIPNQNGVCEILRAEVDIRSALQSLPSGLHLLPAGKWSDEARQAAVGGRLEALLARLKEPYDCVVIHSHALLTVAESVEVARRCEVVLVCARYRQTRIPLVKKATDRVATMEIPYSGVVYVGATEQESLC